MTNFDAVMSALAEGRQPDQVLAQRVESELSAQLRNVRHATWHQPNNPAMWDDYEDQVGLLAGYIARIRGGENTKASVRAEFGK